MALSTYLEMTGGGLANFGSDTTLPLAQNEAGGLVTAESDSLAEEQVGLDNNLAAQERLKKLGAAQPNPADSAYGENAASRWSGTPAVGLAMFRQMRQDGAISGTDFLRATGRIYAGGATNDTPITNENGANIGYRQREQPAQELTPFSRFALPNKPFNNAPNLQASDTVTVPGNKAIPPSPSNSYAY